MQLSNLEIENILSIDKASVSFGDTGLVLVEGFDCDTGRANGAGKSAIFNAISYALFDKIPRKITKSEILRHGTKSGFSMVTLTTPAGENLAVKRSRPSGVEFFKDGVKIELTQAEFESKLGINYDQFLSTMYNAQDSSDRFISLDDRGKKDFILKIMNLESFEDKKKSLNVELAVLNQKKQLLNAHMQGYKNTIDVYRTQVIDVGTYETSILSLENENKVCIAEVKRLEAIEQPDLSKYNDLETQIETKLHGFTATKFARDQRIKDTQALKNAKPSAHCPDCGVGLNAVNGHLVKATDETLIQEQLKAALEDIKNLDEQLAKEIEIRELSKKIKQKKMDEYQDYNAAQISANSLRNTVTRNNGQIKSYKDRIAQNDNAKENMKSVIEQVKVAQDELLAIASEEDIIKTVAAFFDPTGAPAYIMDSVLDYFNDAVSDYITAIWPHATYTLQSYKENKDKSISTKFSEVLVLNGKDTSVGSLSGGEFRALSLATDFAIIDVMCRKFSLDLNPIILDEPFNGLDLSGKELVIELLERIAQRRQVWVVDHSSESKALFSRIIRVEKKNGISNIKEV
jgi:DNA repair exonuclease SbcCD ATPase subunit